METVLITGASSGIGAAFAEIFAKNGYNLVLVARRENELNTLKKKCLAYNVSVLLLLKDLARAEAPKEIYEELKKEKIHVDILINNAGFGTYGSFYKTTWENEAAMIQVNITSLTALSKLFGQEMSQKRTGVIMNVASVAAFLPGPFMSVYYATKAYVLSFSEAIAHDLEGTGVIVVALCPGMTKTEFQGKAGLYEKQQTKTQTPEEVASYGFRIIQKRKSCIAIPGLQNKLIAWLGWMLPRNVVGKIMRIFQAGREVK